MNERQEELLRRVVLGEVSAEDSVVREEMHADAEFAQEVELSLDVTAHIEQAGVLAAAGELSGAPGEERVEAALRVAARDTPPPQVPPRATILAFVATAAALILVGLFLGRISSGVLVPPELPDIMLGPNEVQVLGPEGRGASFATFSWSAGKAARFVEIWVLGGRTGAPQDGGSSGRLPAGKGSWTPTGHASWEDTIEWSLTWYDRAGHEIDQSWHTATR